MKLTNNASADRGFAVKNAAPIMARPGETLDADFDLDHPVMVAWIDEGSVSKGAGKAPQVDTVPDKGYVAKHVMFGNWGVVDKDGVAAKGEDGTDLSFKAADGDAEAKATAAAAALNAA